MVEKVIGYIPVEVDVISARPVEWDGQGINGLKDLEPLYQKRILYRPIMEDLGPHTFTTVDAPELPKYVDIPWVNPKVSHEE